MARSIGLPNAAGKDSTGICFIGERPFREFLGRYLPTRPGPIETDSGDVIGEHQGLAFHTIGQRKGLRIGGTRAGSGEPWFVARKDMARNTLIARALFCSCERSSWQETTIPVGICVIRTAVMFFWTF